METIFTLIEGPFGALVMIAGAILGMLSSPLFIAVPIMYYTSAQRSRRIWFFLLIPIGFLGIGFGAFVLRALIATFFDAAPAP